MMINAFAMWGANSKSWITYQGKVLTHDDRTELEFLCPGQTVRPITLREDEALPIKLHPQFEGYQWPLRREDFW
jgi:hypothetical protein